MGTIIKASNSRSSPVDPTKEIDETMLHVGNQFQAVRSKVRRLPDTVALPEGVPDTFKAADTMFTKWKAAVKGHFGGWGSLATSMTKESENQERYEDMIIALRYVTGFLVLMESGLSTRRKHGASPYGFWRTLPELGKRGALRSRYA